MTNLAESIEIILTRYLPARQEGDGGQFGKSHHLWAEFERFAQGMRGLDAVRKRPNIEVKWSAGQGNWARVPWVALVDPAETSSIQKGVYVVFLFREDMSGVYVTFNQGVSALKLRHGTRGSREILKERAGLLTPFLEGEPRGFATGRGIDLRTEASLGRAYEHSTIAYKLYERGSFPSDAEVDADLEVLLNAYDRYLDSSYRFDFREDDQPETRTVQVDPGVQKVSADRSVDAPFALDQATEEVIARITQRGFVYEPWQIAQSFPLSGRSRS